MSDNNLHIYSQNLNNYFIPSFAPFLCQLRLNSERLSSSRLCRRISWSCRKMPSGYDSCLSVSSSAIRRLAITWRCGSFGRLDKCSVCHLPFSTSHLTSCHLGPPSETLDSLLNSKDHVRFGNLMTIIKSKLYR